jgi:hypothetical protein
MVAAAMCATDEDRAAVVRAHVRAAIAGKDMVAVYALDAELATLDLGDLEDVYLELRTAFGSDLKINSLKTKVKAARIRLKQPIRADPRNSGWLSTLICTEAGSPKPCLANAITALRLAAQWHGVLAYNEFSLSTVALEPPPWADGQKGAWTDQEDRLAADWFQHAGIAVNVEVASQAVQTVAQEQCFHPVRDYLEGLRWDGTKRVDTWLSLYLGADPTDYTNAVGARWLISAVARIFRPGSKVDCCLILEGEQGTLKSTALRTLADPWFTDEIADLGSKDASMQTRGTWIIELAELDGMSRPESSRIKAFMSRATDRFRPPYGRRLIESPRQCVFAGSVNHSTYLRDETGARRFWPVACSRILINDLQRDRDQLWAEAIVRFRAGCSWWLESKELNRAAAEEQADRYESDPWEEAIAAWLADPSQRYDEKGHPILPYSAASDSVTITDILLHCLNKREGTWSQIDKNRIGRCLRALRWERYSRRDGRRVEHRYRQAAPREVPAPGEDEPGPRLY